MLNVPKSVVFVTSLAVIAGAAVSFEYLWRGAPRDARPVVRTVVDSAPAHETVGLAELPRLDRTPNADIAPTFDIVRIEPGGDAVIAGRSLPGTTVELLRDGVIQDKATTDGAGHFVMVPLRLPPGRYELTLVAMQPDGTQVTSKRSIPVALPPSQSK
jgi:hypothetical protein